MKSLQIQKSSFRGSPHIPRDGMRGKKISSPKAEDQITENSIMVVASFINKHKQKKIWLMYILQAEPYSTCIQF